MIIFVDKNSKNTENTFLTITDAINSISDAATEEVTISIAPGRYYERVTLERDNITLLGTGKSNAYTEIFFDAAAFDIMPDGSKCGTFRSYTMFVGASHIKIDNLTISNTSGDPKIKGQAIALYADGDDIIVQNCRLLGRQDTLFTGPLPPKEIQPGGFIGPRQFAERINGHQLYDNCYICGDVDFIFGSATAYFRNCTFESIYRNREASDNQHPDNNPSIQGYVTAASTPLGQEYGYVFESCIFTAAKDMPPESVYLGRPWRDYAHTVFLNCTFGKQINPLGFHDWNKPNARENVKYFTHNCVYSGAENTPFIPQAAFACEIDADAAQKYTLDKVMKG